jgi:hypothetical protein
MPTQADQNLLDISFNRNYRTTNNPNYQFVNFFNLNEPTQYTIGAFNDPKGFNFTPESTIQLAGIHTVDSCKMNATAYDISINNIDYQAKNNYVKDTVKIKTLATPILLNNVVNVDSFNKATSTEHPIGNTISEVKSIEYFGYIVSSNYGNYTVNLNTGVNGNIIAWLQSGAETTYRSSNAHRNTFVDPGVNTSIYLAKNVFVPFRIQIEFSNSTPLSSLPFNITSSTSNVLITDFYMLKIDLKKQVVFSYQTDISQCKIYSGNEFEKYGIDKKIWETGKENVNIEVVNAKEWELNSDTDTVGLDFSGNVVSYNINNTIVGVPIFLSNFTNLNDSSGVNLFSNVYMYLSTDRTHRIKIMRTNLTTSTSGTGLDLVSESSVGTYSVGNPDWNRFTLDTDSNPRNYIYKDRSANGRDQRRDQRITADSPMVTVNHTHDAPRWMLALDKSRNPPYLVLYKNRVSNTTYYGINVDPKTGRTFYENKNNGVEYIREVPRDFLKYAAPDEVSTYSQLTYHTYDEYYPSSGTKYTTTRGCTADCNSKDDCTHVYEVNNGCIFGTGQPTYLPKQPGNNFNSKLHVKQKVLDKNKIPTDISFSRTYQIGNVTSYNNYTMFLPLTENTRAQTSGEYNYIDLQNRAFGSTTTRYNPFQAEPSFNIVNPIGMKEGYISLAQGATGNINTNIGTQLDSLSGEFVSYVNKQQNVMKNATDISAAIVDINRKYTTMANDNSKYDFTTGKINALEDDYTLATALLKDNKIFLEEQSNLKIVGTITLATLLISAIFISR